MDEPFGALVSGEIDVYVDYSGTIWANHMKRKDVPSAAADGHVDVISAFSTDGRIAAFDLLVLDDPREALPPYDAVLLVSPQARKSPELLAALRPLSGAITNDEMRRANKRVDLEDESTSAVAESLSASLQR